MVKEFSRDAIKIMEQIEGLASRAQYMVFDLPNDDPRFVANIKDINANQLNEDLMHLKDSIEELMENGIHDGIEGQSIRKFYEWVELADEMLGELLGALEMYFKKPPEYIALLKMRIDSFQKTLFDLKTRIQLAILLREFQSGLGIESQNDFAVYIEVEESRLNKFFSCQSSPGVKVIKRIAKHLRISPNSICDKFKGMKEYDYSQVGIEELKNAVRNLDAIRLKKLISYAHNLEKERIFSFFPNAPEGYEVEKKMLPDGKMEIMYTEAKENA